MPLNSDVAVSSAEKTSSCLRKVILLLLSALFLGNISIACAKEYLIGAMYWCQVKGEVRHQIAGGYIRGIYYLSTDAIIWDDSGGDTFCRRLCARAVPKVIVEHNAECAYHGSCDWPLPGCRQVQSEDHRRSLLQLSTSDCRSAISRTTSNRSLSTQLDGSSSAQSQFQLIHLSAAKKSVCYQFNSIQFQFISVAGS